jgi:5'-3' exonuclease
VQVHLVDGTYELYRQHFGEVRRRGEAGPRSATVGVLSSTLQLIEDGATHVGVATDHVIESFRNGLWAGYKTSEGMEPVLLEQIPVLAEALRAMGVVVWPMVEHEADDGLASAARAAADDRSVHKVLLLTPDKDLAQCVRGRRVVQVDRRMSTVVDEDGVVAKFGVGPSSIPDWLALVGDSSDGFPGVAGWGAKSASAVLARYGSIEAIPADPAVWAADGVVVRGAQRLAEALDRQRGDAALFKTLATLVDDLDVGTVQDWRWQGPDPSFEQVAASLGAPRLWERAIVSV